jgi:hypothetical protein
MRLDINKIDDRIKKLQEIKRILADPELTALLMEFLTVEAEAVPAPAAPATTDRETLPPAAPSSAEANEEADRIIKEMIQSSATEPAGAANAFWTRGRNKG